MSSVQIIVISIAFIGLVAGVYFSVKYRRQPDSQLRGRNMALMNISLGSTMMLLGISNLFIMTGSWVRLIVGVVFFLLGLFNLFSGIRNYSYYNRKMS